MDTKNENKQFRNTPEYAEYQRDNFWASNEGKVPPFNTGIPPMPKSTTSLDMLTTPASQTQASSSNARRRS